MENHQNPNFSPSPPVRHISNLPISNGNGTWSSLFKRTDIFKTTALQAFAPSVIDGVAAVPLDIIEEGVRDWENYLVGYFIDKKLPFPLVRDVLQKTWKIKGTFEITTDQDVFYMKFSDQEERKIALEGGPIYIAGKLFVVKPWSRETESQRNKIQTLPIWAKISKIPKEIWTLRGIGFLASLLGGPLCTDEATTKRKRLDFAKVCVEIPVEFAFPAHLSLDLGTRIAVVDVEYPWRPQACTSCKKFGHLLAKCPHRGATVWKAKGIAPVNVPIEVFADCEQVLPEENENDVRVDADAVVVTPATASTHKGTHVRQGSNDSLRSTLPLSEENQVSDDTATEKDTIVDRIDTVQEPRLAEKFIAQKNAYQALVDESDTEEEEQIDEDDEERMESLAIVEEDTQVEGQDDIGNILGHVPSRANQQMASTPESFNLGLSVQMETETQSRVALSASQQRVEAEARQVMALLEGSRKEDQREFTPVLSKKKASKAKRTSGWKQAHVSPPHTRSKLQPN